MKKILVLFVLAFGLASFAKDRPITEISIEINAAVCDEYLEVSENGELKTSEYKIEVLYIPMVCTATVTYNGQVQAVFPVPYTSPAFAAMACQLARAQACEYIQNHGGTCPTI